MKRQRNFYLLCIVAVVLAGVASRVLRSGAPLLDKYLGDGLYAALIYLLLSLAWPSADPARKGLLAYALVAAIEVFQLTQIPADMARSGNLLLRLGAVVLGTRFSWLDLLAYAVGIACIFLADRIVIKKPRSDRQEHE